MKWNYKRIAVCFTVLVVIVVVAIIIYDQAKEPGTKPSGTPSPTKSAMATATLAITPTQGPTNAQGTPAAGVSVTVPVSATDAAPTQPQDISPEPTDSPTGTPAPTPPDDVTPTPVGPTDPVAPIPTQAGDLPIDVARAVLVGLGAQRLGLNADIGDYTFEGDEITTVYKGADYYRFDAFAKQGNAFSGTFMVALDGKSIYSVDEYNEFIEIPLP